MTDSMLNVRVSQCSLEYLFRLYLMSSYLYYKENKSKISDAMYDHICKVLCSHYGDFDSEYKYLVTQEDFAAGTGYALVYPDRIKWAALSWYDDDKFDLIW